MFRKNVITLAVVAALLGTSINQSKAVSAGSAAAMAATTTSTATFSAAALAATGFIGVVAVICIFDIYLKAMHYKNWDGTPKTVVHHR